VAPYRLARPDLPAASEVMQRWGTRTSQSFDKPKYPDCKKRQKQHPSAREEGGCKTVVMTSSDGCEFLGLSFLVTSGSLPCLSYGAFDEVHLAAAAWCASKRSQVSAPHARLNHRQSHGTTAGGAQWPLILFIEHTRPMLGGSHRWIPLQGGDRTSLLFRVPESPVKIAHI
jgi:hypothetical protein